MHLTVADVAQRVGGALEGDGTLPITGLARVDHGKPGALTFLYNPKYADHLYRTPCAAALVPADFAPAKPLRLALIRVADPYAAFVGLLQGLQPTPPAPGIHPTAVVDPTATVGPGVYIGPLAVVAAHAQLAEGVQVHALAYVGQGAQLGPHTVLYPQAAVYHGCTLGARCTLHAGAVVGSDGFGYLPDPQGRYTKVPQVGSVVLEDDVEVGANAAIDRATLGATIVRRGAKLDNLVHLAHNTEVGEDTVLAAQVGISGSTRLGARCQVGGQVGFVGHLTVADGTQLGGQAGVARSIKTPNQALRGTPARPLNEQLKAEALMHRLPDLLARLEALEAEVRTLRAAQTGPGTNPQPPTHPHHG